jgi:hypothetical protein
MFDQMTREGRSVTGLTPNSPPQPASASVGSVSQWDPEAVLQSTPQGPTSKPMGANVIPARTGDGTNKNDGALGLTGGFPVDPVDSPATKGRQGQASGPVAAPPRSSFDPSVYGAVNVSSPTRRK